MAVALAALLAAGAAGAAVLIGRAGGSGTPSPGASAFAGAQPSGTTAATFSSPFTGQDVSAARPVLAVKIDNVSPARPQTGLPDADIVYVEPVEGGLSRIMAVFSSRLPPGVGPVRSARESDLELLRQFGHPGLAFSGANGRTLSAIAAAPVTDLSQNRAAAAYSRSASRPAPHNLFAAPARLLAGAQGVGDAGDIGFRFGELPAGTGTPATRETVRHGVASTAFSWSASSHRWLVSFDGRAAVSSTGSRLGASTVVIQRTSITSSGLHDVLGNPTPYTRTTGSGTALVLRDGVAIQARWDRPSAGGGTSYTTQTGVPLTFAAGQIWVVFEAA